MRGYEHHNIHQISQGLFTIGFLSSKRIELDFESTTKTISQKFWNSGPFRSIPQSISVPYPFHTRIMPCRTHPLSPPFVDIQVYSTYQIYPTSSLCCSRASDEIMKYRYVHMYFCYICMYLFLYLYLYLNNIILYYIISK